MSKSGKHNGDSKLEPTTFSWNGDGEFVEIRGSFGLTANPDWKPMPLSWSNDLDKFYITLKLEQGKFYQYKYVVDGKWVCDMNSETSVDASGNLNNILYIPYPNSNIEPGFDGEASTEDEHHGEVSQSGTRQEPYDGAISRRRTSQQSGQSYLPSGGQGSIRKMSGPTIAYEEENSYRSEAAYKSGDLQKWEKQESLARQSQKPRKSSKQVDYNEEYSKQGKELADSESRIRVTDGNNRRPSQTGSESGTARPRSRTGSFQSAEREGSVGDIHTGKHYNATHLPEYQMEYQSLQPEASDNRSRIHSTSSQDQAPLPGYIYQPRQFMPVGPQLREHEAKLGSMSRSSGMAARHVSFDPATAPENYDSVDPSDTEFQPAAEGLIPVIALRQAYPPQLTHARGTSEGSHGSESYTNHALNPEDCDEQIMQTRSQVRSHRRNRFGQGSAQDSMQGYSDQDSDVMDIGGVQPPPVTPLRYSHQAEDVQIPQSSSRRGSINSASFPRGRKVSNPSIRYPEGAMVDAGDELYDGSGFSSRGRQGGSQRLAGSNRPASRLQIPSEFMVVKSQNEVPSYSRHDYNDTSESGTDTMEGAYEGPVYSNVSRKGYPSENVGSRSPGSVGRKGLIPVASQGRIITEIPNYHKPSYNGSELGVRNDVYVDPNVSGRRRSIVDQEYAARPRRRSKADQYEYAESASGKSAIYFDPVSGKFVRSYATQGVVIPPVDYVYDNGYVEGSGSRRRRSNADRVEYYEPIDSHQYEGRGGRNRHGSVSSQGAREDFVEVNPRAGRRRSSAQQVEFIEVASPKPASILKKDTGNSGRYQSALGRSARGSVSSQGARDDFVEVKSKSGRRRPSIQPEQITSPPARFDPATGKFVNDSASPQVTETAVVHEQNPKHDVNQEVDDKSADIHPSTEKPESQVSAVEDENQSAITKESGKPFAGHYDPKLKRFVYDTEAPADTTEEKPLSQIAGAPSCAEHSQVADQSSDSCSYEANPKEEESSEYVDPHVGRYDPVAKKFITPCPHKSKVYTDVTSSTEANKPGATDDAAECSCIFDPATGKFTAASDEAKHEAADALQSTNNDGCFGVGLRTLDEEPKRRFGSEDKTSYDAPPAEVPATEPEELPSQAYETEETTIEEPSSLCPSLLRRVFDPLTGKFIYTEAPPSNAVSRGTPAQLSRRTTGLNNYVTSSHSGLGDTETAENSHDESVYHVSTPATEINPSGGYFDVSSGRFAGITKPVTAPVVAQEPEIIKAKSVAEVPSVEPKYFDVNVGRFVAGAHPIQNDAMYTVPAIPATYPAVLPTPSVVKIDVAPYVQAGAYFDTSTGRFINGNPNQYAENAKNSASSSRSNAVKGTEGSSGKSSGYFDISTGKFISAPKQVNTFPEAQGPSRSNLDTTNTEELLEKKVAPSQQVPYFDPATGKFMNSSASASAQKQSISAATKAGGYFDVITGKFTAGPQREQVQLVKVVVTPVVEATYFTTYPKAIKVEEVPVPNGSYFDMVTGKFVIVSQDTEEVQDTSNRPEKTSNPAALTASESEAPVAEDTTHKKKTKSSGKKHGSKRKSKGKSKNKESQPEESTEQYNADGTILKTSSHTDTMGILRSLNNQAQYPTETNAGNNSQSDSDSCSSEESSDEDSHNDPDDSSVSSPEDATSKAEPTQTELLEMPLFSKTSLVILFVIYTVASYSSSSKTLGSMLIMIPLLLIFVLCISVMNASAWLKYSTFGWRCNADMSITIFEDAQDLDSRSITLNTTNIISGLFLGISLVAFLAMTSAFSFYAVGSLAKGKCCTGI